MQKLQEVSVVGSASEVAHVPACQRAMDLDICSSGIGGVVEVVWFREVGMLVVRWVMLGTVVVWFWRSGLVAGMVDAVWRWRNRGKSFTHHLSY